MKVLLLSPHYSKTGNWPIRCDPPCGLLSISAYLREFGYEPLVVDLLLEGFDNEVRLPDGSVCYGMPEDGVVSLVRSLEPDVIGISCLFTCQWPNVRWLIEVLHAACPTASIVVGGSHVSAVPEECLLDSRARFAVVGEGERPFMTICQALECTEFPPYFQPVPKPEGGVGYVVKREPIANLDTLPFPDRESLPMSRYLEIPFRHRPYSKTGKLAKAETSRGCNQLCTFCSSTRHWGRWRRKSIPRVLAEVDHVIEHEGVEEIIFLDDNITSDPAHAQALFERLTPRKITWAARSGLAVWTLKPPLLKAMAESGLYLACLALESGDPEILLDVWKPTRVDHSRQVVRWCRELGITTHGFFIVGFPGETRDTVRRSIDYAMSLGLDSAKFSIACPFPGTPLYQQCVEQGLLRQGATYRDLHFDSIVIQLAACPPEFLRETVDQVNRAMSDSYEKTYDFKSRFAGLTI